MNTSKGAEGCSVLDLSSAPGAIEELEDTWTLDPDHILQKSWSVFLKSSTRSFHILWGNSKLAMMILRSTKNLGNTDFPPELLLHIPNVTSCLVLFFPLCLTFLHLLFHFNFPLLSTLVLLSIPVRRLALVLSHFLAS